MDHVKLLNLDTPSSVLGMGCASLGSRVSARAGRTALDAALDAGVTWFDLAPAYGAGQAEAIFAAFAADKRDRVQICTKVGLLPPAQPMWKRAIMPIARPIAAAIKPLRAKIKRSGVTANTHVTLTPQLLITSLDQSLSRLKTDHVDVYALHNAHPDDLQNDALLRALEDIKASGKARTIATASSHATAEAGIISEAIGLVQCAHPDMPDALPQRARASGTDCVTHSVFGVAGQLQAVEARLASDPKLAQQMQDTGFATPAALLLARALQTNAGGVVLCSMMSPRSLAANTTAARTAFPPEATALCETLGI